MADYFDDCSCDPEPEEEAVAFSSSVDAVLADVDDTLGADSALDTYIGVDPTFDAGEVSETADVPGPEAAVAAAPTFDAFAPASVPEAVVTVQAPVALPSTDPTFVSDTSDWLAPMGTGRVPEGETAEWFAPMDQAVSTPELAADTTGWQPGVEGSSPLDWSGGTDEWLGEVRGSGGTGSGGASDMMRLLSEREALGLNVGGFRGIHRTPTDNGILDADEAGHLSPPGIPDPLPDGTYRID